MKPTVLLVLLLSIAVCVPLSAQVNTADSLKSTLSIPSKISYQGVLTDNSGTPLNGTFTMQFGLYTTPSGGSALWSETQSVVCSAGIFNVLLGAINPITIAFDAPYYLDITVQGTVLSQRIELASSGYSFNTARIQGQAVSTSSPSSGQVLKWTGSEWGPGTVEALGECDGEQCERVVFNKSELSVINETGVLLNLVATNGGVGIRFYKDFFFGNEMETNPWHMGWIEGVKNYQGLAILRDWAFTAALWEADGKFLVGKLHPHPQVVNGEGKSSLVVKGEGNVAIGASDAPKGIILYDTVNGTAYTLKITNGQIELSPVE